LGSMAVGIGNDLALRKCVGSIDHHNSAIH
jgi:hypothetical protein